MGKKCPVLSIESTDNMPYAFYERTADGTVRDITDELPFDVPDSWEWVRLTQVVEKIGSGSTPTGGKSVYINDGIMFLRSQNVYDDGLRLSGVAYITDAMNAKKLSSVVKANDILLNITGASIGRCAIVPSDFVEANINQHIMIIRLIDLSIQRFLHTVLISPAIQNLIMDVQVGVSREGLSATKLTKFFIPIPPLAEQKRIIEHLEALQSHIADYDTAEQKLTALNAAFPEQLKKSILQAAVQGKLVPQDENDEPASVLLERIRAEREQLIREGKIKRGKHESIIFRRDNSHYEIRDGEEVCIDEELPFEIPETWAWTRLGSVGVFVRGNGIKRTEICAVGVPCIRYGELYTTYNIAMQNAVSFVDKDLADRSKPVRHGDLLFTLTGENKEEIGKAVAFMGNERTVIGGDLAAFTSHQQNTVYLSYLMTSPFAIRQKKLLGTGDIIVHISCDKLASVLTPIPPLKEQARIVKRIESIFGSIEDMPTA